MTQDRKIALYSIILIFLTASMDLQCNIGTSYRFHDTLFEVAKRYKGKATFARCCCINLSERKAHAAFGDCHAQHLSEVIIRRVIWKVDLIEACMCRRQVILRVRAKFKGIRSIRNFPR